MFSIRSSRDDDCDQIYEQTRKLFFEHQNLGKDAHLTPETFRDLHHDCFVQFRVLTVNNGTEEEVIGYIAFIEDMDFNFGGCGIYVDQIYICESFRGNGHGRRLMEAVKAEARRVSANYVKLFYQKNPSREAIYARLGFHNVSTSPPFIKLFEVYGPRDLMARFKVGVNELGLADVPRIAHKPGIEVIEYQDVQDSVDGYGQLVLSVSLGSQNTEDKYPTAQLTIVIKHSVRIQSLPHILEYLDLADRLAHRGICIDDAPIELWSQISTYNANKGITNPDLFTCAFVEQPSVCCWLGRMLTFSNFVGYLGVISVDLLVHRIKTWSPKWGPVLGVRFEVAQKESDNSDNTNHLIGLLNSLGIREDTSWNCTVMTKEEIARDADE
uniref:N-acetyltransferase domain-containing protein n=1 Tax=Mesocestoides corti TaxID=53468 RepID=A0A5K3FAR8_MESCO